MIARNCLECLVRLEGIARELGEPATAAEAAALRERGARGTFYVACVGQFKRGKSTLLNALVGRPVLPTGVVPVTAVVTVVRFGREPTLRVRTDDWRQVPLEELPAYVTESRNPENIKGVTGVELLLPAPQLAGGMALVDTPGLGSVFAGNTAATWSFVPHIDAALVVLGADPPISGEELSLAADVRARVGRVVCVINKADRLLAKDVEEAREFTEAVLKKRLGVDVGPVWAVSATERMAGAKSRDWPALEECLRRWSDQGAALAGEALERGLARLTGRLESVVAAHDDALVRPLEATERRLLELRQAIDEAERSLRQLEPIFRAEEVAVRRELEERRIPFVNRVRDTLSASLLERLQATDRRSLTAVAFDLSQELVRAELCRWALEIQPYVEQLYEAASNRFVVLGNDFLHRVRVAAGDLLLALPTELGPESGLRASSTYYFTELLTVASPGFGIALLVPLLSPEKAVRAVHQRVQPYLYRLLDSNSARVVNDLSERIRLSGDGLRSAVARVLRDGVTVAQQAMERARRARLAGDASVHEERARLAAHRAALKAIAGGKRIAFAVKVASK